MMSHHTRRIAGRTDSDAPQIFCAQICLISANYLLSVIRINKAKDINSEYQTLLNLYLF